MTYNTSTGRGSGTYRSTDIGCSNPEDFSFESVTIESSEEGQVESIIGKPGTNSSSPDPNCAPKESKLYLDACLNEIGHMNWDGLDCHGYLQETKITITCQ